MGALILARVARSSSRLACSTPPLRIACSSHFRPRRGCLRAVPTWNVATCSCCCCVSDASDMAWGRRRRGERMRCAGGGDRSQLKGYGWKRDSHWPQEQQQTAASVQRTTIGHAHRAHTAPSSLRRLRDRCHRRIRADAVTTQPQTQRQSAPCSIHPSPLVSSPRFHPSR